MTQWLGAFPIGVFIYSVLGAILSVAILFRARLDKAADPANVTSSSGVWMLAVTTFVIGFITGFAGAPAVAEWRQIESANFINALAVVMAAAGVPISLLVIAAFEALFKRWIGG